jgi:uncharacterized protein YdeI (YjbR/CyaY-like superfamily)
MAADIPTLDIRTRKQWRQWLAKNHATSAGVWLVRHKKPAAAKAAAGKHAAATPFPYEEMVREALCFGWVDSLVKRLDEDRYAIKVTPRKPTSRWSALNTRRWTELNDAGLLHEAGRAAAPTGNSYAPKPKIPELPSYIAQAFKRHAKAWRAFQALAPSHRRRYVAWIHTAKQQETRERRIRESIRLLTAGQPLGLK